MQPGHPHKHKRAIIQVGRDNLLPNDKSWGQMPPVPISMILQQEQ